MLGVVLREHIHVMLVLHLNFLKHLTKQQHSNIPTLTRSWSQRGICIYAEQIITFRSIVFEGYHKKDLINHGISIPDIFTRLKQYKNMKKGFKKIECATNLPDTIQIFIK